jgi:hypothetical protein
MHEYIGVPIKFGKTGLWHSAEKGDPGSQSEASNVFLERRRGLSISAQVPGD